MPFIRGMKRRRERDVVRTGEIERDLWAREQIRKRLEKGRDSKLFQMKGREQFGRMEVPVTESASQCHFALSVLPVMLPIHYSGFDCPASAAVRDFARERTRGEVGRRR